MAYPICLEENEGRWIAHVVGFPGCYAWDEDQQAVIRAIPPAVLSYDAWCQAHGIEIKLPTGMPRIEEIIRAWPHDEGYLVEAFFAADRPPLSDKELPLYEQLLKATRKDLQAAIEGFDGELPTDKLPGERWSIEGILSHVAQAEWWYMDRVGMAFPQDQMPSEPFQQLERTRKQLLDRLTQLAEYGGVNTLRGETWSARKVLRRTLWHERDHAEHIHKLKEKLA